MDLFFEPFFIMRYDEEEEIELDDLPKKATDKQLDDLLKKAKDKQLDDLQKKAKDKQRLRNKTLGDLLRAKGFMWIATSHDVLGGFQQAGNVVR